MTERCMEAIRGMDDELAKLARGAGMLRYRLGVGLEALARVGGHHGLGFSSVEAYALERCERSARWVQGSRRLARRLTGLPAVRSALVTGRIRFGMAQLLAGVARREDEAEWLTAARGRTVRQMKRLAEARASAERQPASRSVEAEVRPIPLLDAHTSGAGDPARGAEMRSILRDAHISGAGDSACEGEARPTLSLDPELSDVSGSACDAVSAASHCTLTVTVDREDAWLFECARMLAGHGPAATMDETVEALLGEGTTSLVETVSPEHFGRLEEGTDDRAQRAWEAELRRWREEAEERCEANFLAEACSERGDAGAETRFEGAPRFDGDVSARRDPALGDTDAEGAPRFDGDVSAIDGELRGVARELSVRELELGRLAESFWKADGGRRLGYATEAQYARERLGLGLSSVKAKRALARRAAVLPGLEEAVRSGELGYEAARLVASVARAGTAGAWLARARERTVKHLREEVDAAAMLTRIGAAAPARPPSEETMHDLAALESRITSGALFAAEEKAVVTDATEPPCLGRLSRAVGELVERVRARDGAAGGQKCAREQRTPRLRVEARDGAAGGQKCAREQGTPRLRVGAREGAARGQKSAGERLTLRLRVSTEIRDYYRRLERLFAERGPRGASFFRFLCAAVIDTYRHGLDGGGAYGDVYARDRHRCTSPVCSRRDVTPHHLRFRSAGGDESLENLTSLCVWCHLEGVHGGRLAATPPASAIGWTLGRAGAEHTVVHGRRRVTVFPPRDVLAA